MGELLDLIHLFRVVLDKMVYVRPVSVSWWWSERFLEFSFTFFNSITDAIDYHHMVFYVFLALIFSPIVILKLLDQVSHRILLLPFIFRLVSDLSIAQQFLYFLLAGCSHRLKHALLRRTALFLIPTIIKWFICCLDSTLVMVWKKLVLWLRHWSKPSKCIDVLSQVLFLRPCRQVWLALTIVN